MPDGKKAVSPEVLESMGIGRAACGEVLLAPLTSGHTSTESIGGRPDAAAHVSVGSTPANAANVLYLEERQRIVNTFFLWRDRDCTSQIREWRRRSGSRARVSE